MGTGRRQSAGGNCLLNVFQVIDRAIVMCCGTDADVDVTRRTFDTIQDKQLT